MFKCTPVFNANLSATKKVIVNQGGTSSSKTYSIVQVLFVTAINNPRSVITVVGESIPNLKKGAYRDAETIYYDNEYLPKFINQWNRTDRVIYFKNGSIIEFISCETEQAAKNGKRDFLFVNEANGISWQIYWQLAIRTRKRVFIDYNPSAEFWAHEKLIGFPGVQLIISDHRHNTFLSADQHAEIESLREQDEELFKVYGRGLTGKIQGIIFRNWCVVPAIPEGATFLSYGLDFGFTNDETGLLEVYKQNGELWLNELIYERGLTNPAISDRMKEVGCDRQKKIIADNSEPKSITEIGDMGWDIWPATKGPDSIINGIDIVKRYKLNVTASSTNLKKELNKYVWRKDRLGLQLNEPIDKFNHLLDPLRYIMLDQNRGEYTITRTN